MDAEKGTVLHQPLPPKPAPKAKGKMNEDAPAAVKLQPNFGLPGATVQAVIEGTGLDAIKEVTSPDPSVKVRMGLSRL